MDVDSKQVKSGYDPANPNIRNKPSKTSSQSIDQNLKAAAKEAERAKPPKSSPTVQMKGIDDIHPPPDETIVAQKFKVKPSAPRSPAPLPEAVSPAGVPVEVNLQSSTNAPRNGSPLRETITSPLPDGETEIEIVGLKDLDLSMEGQNPGEYRRNKKATAVVALLLFIGLNLMAMHTFMFSWVVEFSSSQTALAAVLYFISSFFVVGTLTVALIKPGFSLGNESQLFKSYSLIPIAGVIDVLAIMIGGSIFGPFIIYSRLSTSYLNMNTMAAILSILVNGGLYFAFTQPQGSSSSKYFHPFQGLHDFEEENGENQEPDLTSEEVRTPV